MAIVMKYGNATGDSTQSDYENWINIDTVGWQIDWSIQNRANIKDNTRDGAHPVIGDITVTKTSDSATTDLLKAITNPDKPNGEDCTIRFLLTSTLTKEDHDADRQPFIEIILNNTLITQIKIGSDANNPRPTETIVLNFTGVTMNVWPLSERNKRLPPARFPHYDKIVNPVAAKK